MFPAAFLALLVPQGALIAVALVPLTPAGGPVIAASLGVFAGLRVRES